MNFFLKLLVLVLLFNTANAQKPAETVPEFTFYKLDNSTFTSKQINYSKKVFIMFFDPTCDHCQKAIAYIGDHYNVFKNVNMYLVAVEDKILINNFVDKYGIKLKGKKNIILLQDKQNMFITKFTPTKYPSMFLFSQQKKLLEYEDAPENMNRFLKKIGR